MKIEQNFSWSEEDEEIIDNIIDYISPMPIFFESTLGKSGKEYTKKFVKKATKWLKSLKSRNTWKPSDAQIASITCAVRKMKESACYDSELVSLLADLKKLKEE